LAAINVDEVKARLEADTAKTFLAKASPPTDPKRVIVFAMAIMLNMLAEASQLFINGTFYVAPVLFMQLVTIHCLWRGQQFPVAFALLPSKDSSTYHVTFDLALLDLVRTSLNISDPYQRGQFQRTFLPVFLSDYETGLMYTIRSFFPAAKV
jgi:hypothetical protein